MEFFVMDSDTLSTFSKEEAARMVDEEGHHLVNTLLVPVVTIAEVIDQHFEVTPDFLSLDVEGLEMELLQSIDFDRYRPTAICVETITYSRSGQERKRVEIAEYLGKTGYMIFADTYINTVFVDENRWRNRNSR